MDKGSLRKYARDRKEYRFSALEAGNSILRQLEALPEWREACRVSIFHNLPTQPAEPSTMPIIRAAMAQGKQVHLPHWQAADIMHMVPIDSLSYEHMLVRGLKMPPLNPTEHDLDLCVVPGLLFVEETGARLGHGYGYYDRWLSLQEKKPYLIGICQPEHLVAHLPMDPHDHHVDLVLYPR